MKLNSIPSLELSPTAIPALAVTAVLLLVLPVLPVLFWKKRCGSRVSWPPLFLGALGFLLSAQVLESGVHMLCIVLDNPVSRFINGHTAAYVIYGALMAGIFEECGRYVIIRFFMKKHRTKENLVMYGIGHGGIEVWAVALLGMVVSFLAIAVTVQAQGLDAALRTLGLDPADEGALSAALPSISAALQFGPMDAALIIFERVIAMLVHISLTVVVGYGVVSGQKRFLPLAVLAHAGVDIFAALYQRGVISMRVAELWFTVCMILLVIWAGKLYRRMAQSDRST